jgi:hypothetical protein
MQKKKKKDDVTIILLSINMLHQSCTSSGFVGAVLSHLGGLI